jgi:hypothetical protein
MFGKGSGHVWSFRSEKDLETLEKSIIEILTYRPIVIHILVIDGQVLKIKTYI